MSATTSGHLLGGRVIHEQLRAGHRTGIEPVLLAASIAARAGDSVLEAGTGAGAALLCLAVRIPGLRGTGIERDPELAALARRNVAANQAAIKIVTGDLIAAAPGLGPFDHAFANPPWHGEAGTASPDHARDAAKRSRAGLLQDWIRALAGCVRRRGSVTLVIPAASLDEALAAWPQAGLGGGTLLPLWPRAGLPSKIVLLRGLKGAKGPFRILPGLTLHANDSRYLVEAEAILRDGAPLPFD